MANRDACLLDGRFDFEPNNKRVWTCVWVGVRMKHLSAGYVLMDANDRPGYISVAYVVQCDFGGRVSDWTLDQIMKRKCRSLLDIGIFLRENRLVDGPFIAVTKLVPQRTRRHCFCCLKSFGVFGTKTNCLKCGEVFCSACCDPWTVRVDGEMMCIDACTICSHEITRAPRRRLPGYGRKSAPDISDQAHALIATITSPTRRTTLVCPNRRRNTSSCKPLWAWQEQPQGLSSTPETSIQDDDLLAQDDDSDRDSIGDDGYDNEPQDAAWSSLPRIEPRRNSISLKKNPAASFKSCPDQLGSSGLTLYKSPINLKYKI
ncbi:hypothetical protein AC1031_014962 [Aphanomyces cochlioides]|nr:hypothetical protein AC1031_014962 [Aphanomyces cochlioides]